MQDNSEQESGSGNQPELTNTQQTNNEQPAASAANPVFKQAGESQQANNASFPQIEPVSWTASDSIAQQRSGRWYGIATAVFVGILAIIIILFVFKILDLMAAISSAALVVVMFIALMISTKSPSHESNYVLSGEGIAINGHNHPFSEFRAFGVRQHGGLWQLVLIPVKRFGVEIVSYIDEQHGERIVDILASFLPMEEVPENGVDKLIERLKI